MAGFKVPAILYAMLCGILWLLPLLQILHAESSAVVAFASFFIAGLSSLSLFGRRRGFGRVLLRQWALLGIPLAMLTFSLLWQRNCEYIAGLLYFILFPGITVFFSVALAFSLWAAGLKYKKLVLVGTGFFIAVAGPIYDLGFHSQFFTYNHVFGGIMGPIYDEEIPVRAGLVAFRTLTVLWSILFLITGVRAIDRTQKESVLRVIWLCTVLLIGIFYLFSARLRMNTPGWYIERTLGGHHATEHFDIYYDPDKITPEQIRLLTDEHEYRYHSLQQQLGIDVEKRIKSYIYPDEGVKDWLTGSRTTSVAPVWLRQPQMHMAIDVFEQVFAHELAHIFSREFGLPVINASLSVGLVEGLAVSLEPSDGRPFPHEQVLTAATLQELAGGASRPTVGDRLKSRLSPFGFWTGRGAVSYTTMGSFVQFLADAYGYNRFMEVYAYSNFEQVYGKPVDVLVDEWETYLSRLPAVSLASYDYVTRRFSIPSIFEKECPHHVPLFVKKYREGTEALARADTAGAMRYFQEALRLEPPFQAAVDEWARISLAKGHAESVIARVTDVYPGDSTAYMTPGLWIRLGDAYALERDEKRALAAYDSAMAGIPLYLHQQKGLIESRKVIADNPEMLSVLLSAADPGLKVKQLAANWHEEGIVSLLQGILLAVNNDMEAAKNYLDAFEVERISLPEPRKRLLQRMYDAVRVQVYYQAGHVEEALEQAERIRRDFETVGASPEAAQYADFAGKMRYIMQRE